MTSPPDLHHHAPGPAPPISTTLATRPLNWKGSSHVLTAVNAPTFTVDRGYQSAGAGSYLDTNYLPSAHGINYTLNAACFGLWSRTGDSSTNWDIGGASGAQLIRIRCRSGSNTSLRINSSAADESFTNSDGSGLFVANRSGASATQCYRNGASLGSGTAAATTMPGGAGNLFVCAMNPNEANPSIRQQALAFFGGSLSADEVAALYAAFAYHLDAIGAI